MTNSGNGSTRWPASWLIRTPGWNRRNRSRRAFQAFSLGLNVRLIDGALVVMSVHPESDAYWAGVRSGMKLTRIAGRDAWRNGRTGSRRRGGTRRYAKLAGVRRCASSMKQQRKR